MVMTHESFIGRLFSELAVWTGRVLELVRTIRSIKKQIDGVEERSCRCMEKFFKVKNILGGGW